MFKDEQMPQLFVWPLLLDRARELGADLSRMNPSLLRKPRALEERLELRPPLRRDPLLRRNRKAPFRQRRHVSADAPRRYGPEHGLRLVVAQPHRKRQCRSVAPQLLIEKRAARFERVEHRRAIHLGQIFAGETLIEVVAEEV